MTKDDTEIVSALQVALADRVGKERYELWFGANARIALEADALRVCVPNRFYQDWLRTHFRRDVEICCAAAAGRDVPVTFEVDHDFGAHGCNTQALAAVPCSVPEPPPHNAGAPRNCAAEPAPRDEHAPATARRRFANLESFVGGAGNRLATSAAREIAEQPGRVSPLVIHGPTGVGKTHLLEGIWTAAKRHHPRLHAVYLSAEQFTNYFLEAMHSSGLPNFRHKYRGVSLLIVDDVQFFAGKRATLTELLHTIDTLSREGRQLVFSADRPPANLTGLGPELVARLSAGLVCRIDPPDYETRLGIVSRECARLDLHAAADVQAYVANSFPDHARQLTGALLKLRAASRALSRPITMALAVETLAEVASRIVRDVKLADVQQAVCEVLGVDPDALRSNRRISAVAHPRMLAMWLARKHTRAALAEIGEFFGKRSHTTVIAANKKVGQWLGDPQSLKLADHTLSVEEAVRRVEERLRAS